MALETKGDVKRAVVPTVGLSGEVSFEDAFGDGLGEEEKNYFNPKYASKFMSEFQVGKQKLKLYGNPMVMQGQSGLIESFMDAMSASDPPYELASAVDVIYPRSLMAIWVSLNFHSVRVRHDILNIHENIALWPWINYFIIPMTDKLLDNWVEYLTIAVTLEDISNLEDDELVTLGKIYKKYLKTMQHTPSDYSPFNILAVRNNLSKEKRALLDLEFFDVIILPYRRGEGKYYAERMDLPADAAVVLGLIPSAGRFFFKNKASDKYYFIDQVGKEVHLDPSVWELVTVKRELPPAQPLNLAPSSQFVVPPPQASISQLFQLGVPLV